MGEMPRICDVLFVSPGQVFRYEGSERLCGKYAVSKENGCLYRVDDDGEESQCPVDGSALCEIINNGAGIIRDGDDIENIKRCVKRNLSDVTDRMTEISIALESADKNPRQAEECLSQISSAQMSIGTAFRLASDLKEKVERRFFTSRRWTEN